MEVAQIQQSPLSQVGPEENSHEKMMPNPFAVPKSFDVEVQSFHVGQDADRQWMLPAECVKGYVSAFQPVNKQSEGHQKDNMEFNSFNAAASSERGETSGNMEDGELIDDTDLKLNSAPWQRVGRFNMVPSKTVSPTAEQLSLSSRIMGWSHGPQAENGPSTPSVMVPLEVVPTNNTSALATFMDTFKSVEPKCEPADELPTSSEGAPLVAGGDSGDLTIKSQFQQEMSVEQGGSSISTGEEIFVIEKTGDSVTTRARPNSSDGRSDTGSSSPVSGRCTSAPLTTVSGDLTTPLRQKRKYVRRQSPPDDADLIPLKKRGRPKVHPEPKNSTLAKMMKSMPSYVTENMKKVAAGTKNGSSAGSSRDYNDETNRTAMNAARAPSTESAAGTSHQKQVSPRLSETHMAGGRIFDTIARNREEADARRDMHIAYLQGVVEKQGEMLVTYHQELMKRPTIDQLLNSRNEIVELKSDFERLETMVREMSVKMEVARMVPHGFPSVVNPAQLQMTSRSAGASPMQLFGPRPDLAGGQFNPLQFGQNNLAAQLMEVHAQMAAAQLAASQSLSASTAPHK